MPIRREVVVGASRRVEEVAEERRPQEEAADRLRAHPYENGALDLETIDARPVLRAGRVVEMRGFIDSARQVDRGNATTVAM